MKTVIREIASIVTVQTMLMMIFVALLLIFYDCKKMKKKGAPKDYKIARFVGISYLVLGIGLYLVGKLAL